MTLASRWDDQLHTVVSAASLVRSNQAAIERPISYLWPLTGPSEHIRPYHQLQCRLVAFETPFVASNDALEVSIAKTYLYASGSLKYNHVFVYVPDTTTYTVDGLEIHPTERRSRYQRRFDQSPSMHELTQA